MHFNTTAATGARSVTDGKFDLPLATGGVGPGDASRSLTAKVDGAVWNAAVVGGHLGSGLLQAEGDGKQNGVASIFVLISAVCAAGTYVVNVPQRTVSLTDTSGFIWDSSRGGGGTVTVSTFSSAVIKGTIDNVVLGPFSTGATGNRTVTEGTFSFANFILPPTCGLLALANLLPPSRQPVIQQPLNEAR
jgi:hypothetical protein